MYELVLKAKQGDKQAFTELILEIEDDLYKVARTRLNYEERIIMTLYYSDDYTTKEIGEILNINENTVKTKIRRAREKIKNKYKGEIKE